MHVGADGSFELTYCTNIHPGESLDEVERNLVKYTVPLKQRLAPDRPFGVGLWLSDAASRAVETSDRLERFKELLEQNGLYVFTLNGFPYGGFHRRRVKDEVYAPDWRTDERLDYTRRLARILAELLPPGTEGSISTSPISYKPWLGEGDSRDALVQGAVRLADVAAQLHEIRERGGTLLHLGIEPEPDCLIENSRETVEFVEEVLLRDGTRRLEQAFGMSRAQAESVLREHIRVCYDTCHFAVEFESPDTVLDLFERAGIRLSKIQISSALRLTLAGNDGSQNLRTQLAAFAESTYLHQVVARVDGDSLVRYPDLPEALPHLETAEHAEWRIHYHVPIFIASYAALWSTQNDLRFAVERVMTSKATSHLEIETYTWDVLPDGLKMDVVSSIEREYRWLIEQFALLASR